MKTQIKLEITNTDLNDIVFSEVFDSEELAQGHVDSHLYDYGHPSSEEQVLTQEYLPEVKEIQLIEGVETEVVIQEEQQEEYQTVTVPSNVTYEIKDISKEVYDLKVRQLQILNIRLAEGNKEELNREIQEIMDNL